MKGKAAKTEIPTHNLQVLGIEISSLNNVDNLGIDVHVELSTKWYIYTSDQL